MSNLHSSSTATAPNVLHRPTYQTLVDENVAILQQLLPDYQPLESDNYMLLIEAFAYRELHLRQLFNNRLKSLLLPYALKSDLDLVATFYGVKRLANESDDQLRERTSKSLHGYSTAGSKESYEFHAYSVNDVISDVNVFSPEKGKVTIVLASFKEAYDGELINSELISAVSTALNNTKVRPITDEVTVVKAQVKAITINANIVIFNQSQQAAINDRITDNLSTQLTIGQKVTYSQLIRHCHIEGVYKVDISNINDDIACANNEIVKFNTINLAFSLYQNQ